MWRRLPDSFVFSNQLVSLFGEHPIVGTVALAMGSGEMLEEYASHVVLHMLILVREIADIFDFVKNRSTSPVVSRRKKQNDE